MSTVIDLQKNPKQFDYFMEVMKACAGVTQKRKFGYGGAIRGGKTFVTLAVLLRLCNKYPGSKWHIVREDFPVLQATTIPSLEKIISGSKNWDWVRDRSNYYAYNNLGSKIFFKGENIKNDPELSDFLGLETNGFFIEQMEGVSRKLWDIAISRAGSWYIDPMPPAFMFTTVNPTQRWPKEFLHDRFMKGELPEDFFYMTASPHDNAFVTKDQWNAWGSMDERYQKQFIEGDWTNFDEKDNRFAYCYSKEKHVGLTEINNKTELYLSFDFNHDPISCGVYQHYNTSTGLKIRGIEQIKLSNSNIYDLCDRIIATYGNRMFIVTGDATGRATSAIVKDNMNYYTVIKSKLKLMNQQLRVHTVNPTLEENRVLVNFILKNTDIVLDKEKCSSLIYDLENARVLPDGSLDKTNRNDPTKQLDALDGLRYYLNTFHRNLLKF